MAGIGKGLAVSSTVLTGVGGLARMSAEKSIARSVAQQAHREASMARGSAQRAASEEIRQSRLAASRARAVAAASGAGVTDPSIVNRLADLETEGLYGALSRLFTGETEARGLEDYAASAKRTARSRNIATAMQTASTVFKDVQSIRGKYGGTRPST